MGGCNKLFGRWRLSVLARKDVDWWMYLDTVQQIGGFSFVGAVRVGFFARVLDAYSFMHVLTLDLNFIS
jgi:hypothetical protein